MVQYIYNRPIDTLDKQGNNITINFNVRLDLVYLRCLNLSDAIFPLPEYLTTYERGV